jgi:uncharacterized protein with ParB-like and HNH nuclease domain
MTTLDTQKYTINNALKNCFYIVPDYQREYVWKEKQVTQLLEDINEQMGDSSSIHFIGTILVSPTIGGKENCFDVIDGQQRLITIFLILCALRALSEDDKRKDHIGKLIEDNTPDNEGNLNTQFRILPSYEDTDKLIGKIAQSEEPFRSIRSKIESSGSPQTDSVTNILKAYEIILKFLADNYDCETKLKKYFGHLSKNVIFIQISTDISSALKVFETINERGVGLNPMDLLKNLLFSKVKGEEFEELKTEWKKITSPLEGNKEKPLRFLRYFLMANYNTESKQKDGIIREDGIYDWFLDKDNIQSTGYQDKPLRFVEKIKKNVNLYIHFSKNCGKDGNPSDVMKSLQRFTGKAFSLHYILLLAAAPLPKSVFDQFVAQLESFLFFFIITKTPAKELERNFFNWAKKIREITGISDSEVQTQKLNEFVNKYFKNDMEKKKDDLDHALKNLTTDSIQSYRMKHLLMRLTQHVEISFQGNKEISLEQFNSLQIEHILPNNPKDDLQVTWGNNNPEISYDDSKIRLGNLTLLESSLNKIAGNNFYNDKVNEYKNSTNYLTRSLVALVDSGKTGSIININEKLASYKKWDAEHIEDRQSKLINLIYEIWKISEIKA